MDASGLRMVYSMDFSTAGRLKRKDGSLRAIMRHNNRIPRLELESEAEPRLEGVEGGTPTRNAVWRGQGARKWKENIDPDRICHDQIWLNPMYGGDGVWTAPADLPVTVQSAPDAPVMVALHGLLGIDEVDGKFLYGEGFGDCGGRRRKEAASAKSKRRRKTRKAVRDDAVLAVDVILQASPSFFFPKIRVENWNQKKIDTSMVWERGELDQGAVDAFRDAGFRWATEWWGADHIAEIALHLDESCPHMHIVVIPEADGRLRGGSVVAGPAEAKKMLDDAEPFFRNLHAGMSLERPECGGQSTGVTYSKRNRALREEAEVAEARKAEAFKAESESQKRRQTIEDGIRESEGRKAKAEAEAAKAEKEYAEKLAAMEQAIQQAEARKAEAFKAESESQKRRQTIEDGIREVEERLDRREARLRDWTDAFARATEERRAIEADMREVQEAGDEAVERLRAVMRQRPGCKASDAVRRVAESYKAEVVEARWRAEEAEDALANAEVAMGPLAWFLGLPARVARGLWTGLINLLDVHVPGWLEEMRRQEKDMLKAERQREADALADVVATMEKQLNEDGDIPLR